MVIIRHCPPPCQSSLEDLLNSRIEFDFTVGTDLPLDHAMLAQVVHGLLVLGTACAGMADDTPAIEEIDV